jgi:Family of unknown function (DUF5681)
MADDSGGDGRQQVGYRSPPKAHRFKKGQSGNPLGRPPKSQTRKSGRSPLGKAYIAEAHRKLRINESGKVSQLKTIEIAVRRQGMAAVGGDLKAQREFVAGVRLAERDERSRNEQLFDAALEYIALCETIRDEHKRLRLRAPEFEIDPDDILTDVWDRTVSLSARAQNRLNATSLVLDHLRQQLTREAAALEQLLAANPDNRAIRRDLEFLRQMLRRLS